MFSRIEVIDRRKYDLLLMCAPPAVGEATARGREIEREREREIQKLRRAAAPGDPEALQRALALPFGFPLSRPQCRNSVSDARCGRREAGGGLCRQGPPPLGDRGTGRCGVVYRVRDLRGAKVVPCQGCRMQ